MLQYLFVIVMVDIFNFPNIYAALVRASEIRTTHKKQQYTICYLIIRLIICLNLDISKSKHADLKKRTSWHYLFICSL